jgi:hypothetical protein
LLVFSVEPVAQKAHTEEIAMSRLLLYGALLLEAGTLVCSFAGITAVTVSDSWLVTSLSTLLPAAHHVAKLLRPGPLPEVFQIEA